MRRPDATTAAPPTAGPPHPSPGTDATGAQAGGMYAGNAAIESFVGEGWNDAGRRSCTPPSPRDRDGRRPSRGPPPSSLPSCGGAQPGGPPGEACQDAGWMKSPQLKQQPALRRREESLAFGKPLRPRFPFSVGTREVRFFNSCIGPIGFGSFLVHQEHQWRDSEKCGFSLYFLPFRLCALVSRYTGTFFSPSFLRFMAPVTISVA